MGRTIHLTATFSPAAWNRLQFLIAYPSDALKTPRVIPIVASIDSKAISPMKHREHHPYLMALALSLTAALLGCDITKSPHTNAQPSMSAELDVTQINRERPPGRLERLVDVTTMLDTLDSNGQRILVERGVRKAGTRVAIHVHEYGGHTCVLSGEITDFVEGRPPKKFRAGTCYYMPPNVLMTAANLSNEDAVVIDTFILPPGRFPTTIREPGYPAR